MDPSQFDYIVQFLRNLLNVDDPTTITLPDLSVHFEADASKEILPDVTFPNDIWFRDNISIRDCKIKVTMLHEINIMLTSEINKLDQPLEDMLLMYYQKLLAAYKFYELPAQQSYGSDVTNNFSVREELEDEIEDLAPDEGKSLNRTVSNQSSTTSLKTHHSFFSHSSANINTTNFSGLGNGKHTSTSSSGPYLGRRRFSSIVSNNNSNANSNGSSPHKEREHEEIVEEESKRQQALNSLLSKSYIYNKIKKHRESTSSMNSNISLPSVPYSGRNSVSTTATMNSAKSKRSSSNFTSLDNNELKHPSFPVLPSFASYTSSQRLEFQRSKQEYYLQIQRLLESVQAIIHQLQLNHKDAKAFKLMDFIKRYVFRFVVIDASELVLTYGEIEAYRLYSRLNQG
ncbi:hypothetical protein PSN45_000923 [Yamadazyma tenuis]|uniref:uncharacterized protein n=1 Tax=Candida tenuis TaxID=2315449 RepID=UPI0027A01D06|nr:hypothetical protein PSN45_000923 [Yamadazyma tenuis]